MKLPAVAISCAALISCGGCATTPQAATASEPTASCNAEALPAFAGQTASAETGARILQASGARTLRWAGPGMMITMDYRADRVTVSYNRDMVIERVSCG